jgi:hypothetical protein
MVRKILWVLGSVVLLGVGAAAWLGAFRTMVINDSVQGGYIVAGYDHTGPFEEIGPVFERAHATTDSLGIVAEEYVGVYYSNPDEVAEDSLQSFAGVVVGRGEEDLGTLDYADLRLERIPEGRALWIEAPKPNDLAMIVAIIRAYPKLGEAAQKAGLEPGWVYEVHTDSTVRFVFQEYPVAQEAIDL